MKKTFGKENNGKFWRNAVMILLLFIIAAFGQTGISAQTSPCDFTQDMAVSRVGVTITVPGETTIIGSKAGYDITRSGTPDHYVIIESQAPANTVFRAYLNGVELGTLLVRLPNTPNQFWFWEVTGNNAPVGRVGDVLTVTKNGQPFITETYTRPTYDYEETWGYADGILPYTNASRCTYIYAKTYLPNSATPRKFYIDFGWFYATAQITKLTLNEPSGQPNVPGNEIHRYQFSRGAVTNFPGWFFANINESDFILNENQYNLLRQGLLTMTIYTAQHPNGYKVIPLTTQGINSSGDFEGDGIADLAVFRPSERKWYVQFSSNNQTQIVNFGLPNDKLVVSDYDGDGKTDIAVFQTDNPNYPGQGIWQILQSSNNSLKTISWGLPGDIPLSLDIDANNTRDLGIFRPSSGTWYIHRMGDIIKPLTNNFGGETDLTVRWGTAGDKPLTGDFNGDRVDELVAFRPSEGNWYIYNYLNGGYQVIHWGVSNDVPMLRDFDGDRKVDLAVYRPSEGNWYIRNSIDGSITIRRFGLSEDIPVPADFDKDGVADIAVFRPSNGTWYVTRSSDNSFFAAQFGLNGDIPAFAQR